MEEQNIQLMHANMRTTRNSIDASRKVHQAPPREVETEVHPGTFLRSAVVVRGTHIAAGKRVSFSSRLDSSKTVCQYSKP